MIFSGQHDRFARLLVTMLAGLMLGACQGVPMAMPAGNAAVSTRVVVLHGLKRSAWSMKKIERQLARAGFEVCNVDYPSDRLLAAGLVDHIVAQIHYCFGETPGPLNFVSHSLGGLMVRALEISDQAPPIARAVMLAPPNHGSKLVDVHRNSALFRSLMGPISVQLGTDPGSLPRRLGPATFDVGIIAGVGNSNPMGLWVFDEPNDGTVSVASTRLEGMNDFIEVPYGHTFIMRKRAVINEIEYYLKSGSFSPLFKQ